MGPADARHCDFAFGIFRSPSGDVDFYRGLAREAGGPVLELGCGTGRVLLPIALDGIACTGLDSSEAMLGELKARRPPENLRLVSGSMRDFDFGSARFGLIFSAFGSFQHVLAVEDQLACLDAVRRHLAPGGFFAFDVFTPRLERIVIFDEPEAEEARWREDETEIIRLTAVRRDPATQVMEVTFRYERRPRDLRRTARPFGRRCGSSSATRSTTCSPGRALRMSRSSAASTGGPSITSPARPSFSRVADLTGSLSFRGRRRARASAEAATALQRRRKAAMATERAQRRGIYALRSNTSAIPQTASTTETNPFAVKKAALIRERSPGFTIACW
jgi:SAM-dependent methyltransferase